MKSERLLQISTHTIISALLLFTMTCKKTEGLQLGMQQQEVINLLGEPDHKAFLDGKVLRSLSDLETNELDKYRIVFTYEDSDIQVWFKAGKVTGATRKGISVFITP